MSVLKRIDAPRIGLGTLPLAAEGKPDRDVALATIRAAIEGGIGLIDTADCYGMDDADYGAAEELVAEVLDRVGRPVLDGITLATKGGLRRGDQGRWVPHGEPEKIKAACRGSLRRLGVEAIDLYQLHRPDPAVPYEDSIGALQELREEGLVVQVGVSNVDDRLLDIALASGPIASVQNQFSVFDGRDEPMLARCADAGIAYLVWGPLGGRRRAGSLDEALVGLRPIAAAHDLTLPEIALAWLIGQGDQVLPIPGATSPAMVESALRAAQAALTEEELAAVAAASEKLRRART